MQAEALASLSALNFAVDNAEDNSESDGSWWDRNGGTLVGGVVTAGVGGFLINKATRDIQKSQLSAAQQAAYDEWMNNVGNHLRCFIGVEEAGEYGDIIQISAE